MDVYTIPEVINLLVSWCFSHRKHLYCKNIPNKNPEIHMVSVDGSGIINKNMAIIRIIALTTLNVLYLIAQVFPTCSPARKASFNASRMLNIETL